MKSSPGKILERLAYNLRWTWHAPTTDLFHTLAPDVWDTTHNPIAVLGNVDSDALEVHAGRLAALAADLDDYLNCPPRVADAPRVAYFSAEFAVAECLPIYAGGLGVLAGDHLKAASDQRLPVFGIGLLYRYGFLRHDRLDTSTVPLRPVFAADGVPLEIGVPFPDRTVVARVWVAQVGRVPLYLLDTDLHRNREDDRWITADLYGGDQDTRLRQDMVLGIGGVRLVRSLGLLGLQVPPLIHHLNESHAAFVALERAAERMRGTDTTDFFAAHHRVASSIALTTCVPLARGDAFPAELIEAYLGAYRQRLGLTHTQLMALGRRDVGNPDEDFSMTVFARRSTRRAALQVQVTSSFQEAAFGKRPITWPQYLANPARTGPDRHEQPDDWPRILATCGPAV
jgi:starch phosphorylase